MPRHTFFLIIFIIIVGASLRCYNFFLLPFTFDELSAITRLNYASLNELIDKAVKQVDTHPAGIQVFLYYWCKLFGTTEWVVKLPFVLIGIATIPMAFLVCRNWFGTTPALITSAYIATLQFTVTYSTIARPYIPGLFFSLLMVYTWTKCLFEKFHIRYIVLYVLSATLCCYIHYFSLLFAIITGATGLFFLKKNSWKWYFLSNFIIVILCLPHLGIFLFQIKRGGLGGPDGWLSAPSNNFLLTYIAYIFNHSYLSGGITIVCCLIYYFFKKSSKPQTVFKIVCLLWFLLPFCIGFFYSKWKNPILQYSILIFSFPYLIMFLSSFIVESKKWIIALVLIIIMSGNIYSLVYTRQHYEILFHQPSDQYAKYINHLQQLYPNKKIFSILNTTENLFMEYYNKKSQTKFDFHVFQPKEDTPASLSHLITEKMSDILITGFLPDEYTAFFKQQFPYLIYRSEGFTYDINCLSKNHSDKTIEEKIIYSQANNFNYMPAVPPWSFDLNMIREDSSTLNKYLFLDSIHEWGPGFAIPLNEILSSRITKIIASVKIKPNTVTNDEILVLQINQGDSMIRWQGSDISKYYMANAEWQTIYTSCNLIDVLPPGINIASLKLNVYLWNKAKANIQIDDLTISVFEGNSLVYGLYHPIGE